jgi:hypothetical protein
MTRQSQLQRRRHRRVLGHFMICTPPAAALIRAPASNLRSAPFQSRRPVHRLSRGLDVRNRLVSAAIP